MKNCLSTEIVLGFIITNFLFIVQVKCIIKWNENNTGVGCDFNGNDLSYIRTTSSQCRQECYDTPECTHFTWTQYEGGTCWMKTGSVSLDDAQSATNESMICGIINRSENSLTSTNSNEITTVHWNETDWMIGCDFHGNDLYSYQTSAQNCRDLCIKIFECTHFTWTTFQNGTCWMKKSNVSKNDAFVTGDKTMICGIVNTTLKRPPTLVNRGTTSAYWDCCKSTCQWPIKTNNTQSSKRCYRNDSTILDGDTILGCNNGTTYTCNNRIPWNVTANLSYGFAAATIANQRELDWCYACYSLIFTSDLLGGKQLIVMVINTNSGSNNQSHFNLQIPGSGWDLFNQCSHGFPNSISLNIHYGHVQQRSECANLPIAVQSGCYWRFDWFNNADNPNVNFSEVLCPNVLIKKVFPTTSSATSSKTFCYSFYLLILMFRSFKFN